MPHYHHSHTYTYSHYTPCGCYFYHPATHRRHNLALVKTKSHATVLSTATHTTLTQTWFNDSGHNLEQCYFEFPLYDGISVTSFTCTIGGKTLYGVVRERAQARAQFDAAVARGEQAGLLEQDVRSSDVFTTSLGNFPDKSEAQVVIEYVGELKQDAGADALRLTIPCIIAPRYGDPLQSSGRSAAASGSDGLSIVVDINLAEGSPLKGIESPSHPISVSLGTLSTDGDADPVLTKGSASLSLQDRALDKDFVLLIKAKSTETPRAILEQHPTLGYRALMTTLVPRFALPSIKPEIVFVADRSGSMGSNIPMLKAAMRVFLQSLPTGVKFNICSFGSNFDFLFSKSKSYDQDSLNQALKLVDQFASNYGGTETLKALEGTIKRRFPDIPLEIILLTDGDIWDQAAAFATLEKEVEKSKQQVRLFTLGIGNGVSHSLIEGLARSGNGFAQSVQDGERMDTKVVRMLKGALSPHITDYTLEIAFGEDTNASDDSEYEMVEKVADSLDVHLNLASPAAAQAAPKPTISLFDETVDPTADVPMGEDDTVKLPVPNLLQAPSRIPSLFTFIRTTAYVLLSPHEIHRHPVAVILRGTSTHGPLELKIPVTTLDAPGTVIHSLAARKSTQELEEGRGWVHAAKQDGRLLSKTMPSRFEDLVKREAVRLGETFQVANRWCSFVAVEAGSAQQAEQIARDKEHETQQQAARAAAEALPRERVLLAQGLRELGSFNPAPFPMTMQQPAASKPMQQRAAFQQVQQRAAPQPMYSQQMCAQAAPQQMQFQKMFAQAGPPAPPPPAAAACAMASTTPGAAPSRDRLAATRGGGGFGAGGGSRGGRGGGVGTKSKMMKKRKSDTTDAKSAGASIDYSDTTMSFGLADADENDEMDTDSDSGSAPPQRPKRAAPSGSSRPSTGASAVPPHLSDADRVLRIIALQAFDGKWAASAELAALLRVTDAALQAHGPALWTALAIAFLQRRMGGERDVWEMVVEKAQAWLDAQPASDVAAATTQAEAVVGS